MSYKTKYAFKSSTGRYFKLDQVILESAWKELPAKERPRFTKMDAAYPMVPKDCIPPEEEEEEPYTQTEEDLQLEARESDYDFPVDDDF